MTEKALKVVILDNQGQIYVFPNSFIEMDITLEDLVDTIKTERGLMGDYQFFVHVSDLTQPLSNLRIRAKDISGVVILPAAMQRPKVRLG